jgi:hypothetical protein
MVSLSNHEPCWRLKTGEVTIGWTVLSPLPSKTAAPAAAIPARSGLPSPFKSAAIKSLVAKG